MNVRPARATDVYQFAYFETDGAPPHVEEVEQWVRQHAWAWFRDGEADEDRRLLVAELDGEVVGVVAHLLVDSNTRYVMVVVVEPERRGHGLGRRLVEEATADMQARSPGCGMYGLVDPANDAMKHLAEVLGAVEGGPQEGYLTFMRSFPGES